MINTHVNVKFETEMQYCHAITTVIVVEIAVEGRAGTYRHSGAGNGILSARGLSMSYDYYADNIA